MSIASVPSNGAEIGWRGKSFTGAGALERDICAYITLQTLEILHDTGVHTGCIRPMTTLRALSWIASETPSSPTEDILDHPPRVGGGTTIAHIPPATVGTPVG